MWIVGFVRGKTAEESESEDLARLLVLVVRSIVRRGGKGEGMGVDAREGRGWIVILLVVGLERIVYRCEKVEGDAVSVLLCSWTPRQRPDERRVAVST